MRYNRYMDLTRIKSILTKDCCLTSDRSIVVGVSGGADSLCLLYLLNSMGYPVIVAHVNHLLRQESGSEEALVEYIAKTLHLPFYSTKVDVGTYSHSNKLSMEESARYLRYEFLFRVAEENDAQSLAVAHHADDQIETVMMHILRGAGPAGLRSMGYRSFLPGFSKDIPIVRPLLGMWRSEIEDYCRQENLDPCIDQTNSDKKYFRNRIRHELIPFLETYNPQAKQHLWQLANLAQAENAFLDTAMEDFLNNLVSQKGKGFFALKRAEFVEAPAAIQRQILRQIIGELREDLRDISFDAVEKGIEFARSADARGEWQLLENIWLTRLSKTELMIFTEGAELSELFPLFDGKGAIALVFPGVTNLNDRWEIDATILKGAISPKTEMTDNEVIFDLSELQELLEIRLVSAGEKIIPFGKKEISQKLSDLFINLGVLRRARSQWPILYCGDKLLWVVGLRRAKFAPVKAGSKRILKLELKRKI